MALDCGLYFRCCALSARSLSLRGAANAQALMNGGLCMLFLLRPNLACTQNRSSCAPSMFWLAVRPVQDSGRRRLGDMTCTSLPCSAAWLRGRGCTALFLLTRASPYGLWAWLATILLAPALNKGEGAARSVAPARARRARYQPRALLCAHYNANSRQCMSECRYSQTRSRRDDDELNTNPPTPCQ